MTTTYPILTSRVQTGTVDASVTSAYGGSGQLISYSGVTDSVRLWNQDTNFKIQYKVDAADWVELGPNKQVSFDLDLSVSAIRLRLAEFVPSGRSAQIEYTPKASGVYVPDAEGRAIAFDGITGGGSTPISFSAVVPFNAGNSVMPRTAVSGALAFTVNSSGAADGNAAQVELISDGANVPTFTGMAEWGTSFGYDNSQAGLRNLIQFFRSGGAYYYSISQPAVNTPIDLVAPTAGTATVENATATVINLVISEAADTSAAPSAASFAVPGHTVSSVAWGTSTRLDITVTPAFVNGEAARTLAYTPGTNPIKDVAGNLMAAFSGKAITNNVGSGLESEVTAWLGRVATAGGTVSAGTQTAVNNFVVSAKANGYWSTFQRLNLFCGDQAASLVPLVNTVGGTVDTNTGTTYAESTGPVTNGTSQYISTGLTPNSATGGISVYLRTTQASDTTTRCAIGCRDTGTTQVYRVFGNSAADATTTAGAVSGSWGGVPTTPNPTAATTGGMVAALWHIVRTGATAITLYKNGASAGTSATSVTPASPSTDLRLFGSNPAGGATNAYLAAGSAIGAYGVDTGMNGTQAGNYRTDMQAFQTALSRNV